MAPTAPPLPLNIQQAASWVTRGLQAAAEQRVDEAKACFENALSLQPDQFEALHHLGLIAYRAKAHFLALGYFSVALQLQPHHVVLLSNQGSLYKELKLFELSKATYLQALAVQDQFAPLHFNFANLLFEMHDTEGALKGYQAALALNPQLTPAYTNAGNMLTKLRKYDDAQACYDQALALDPSSGLAHANKGKLLKEQFRFDEALQSFELAERYAPEVAKVYVLKAELLNLMKHFEAAVLNYNKAKALDPHYEFLLGLRLHNKMLGGDWAHFETDIEELRQRIESGGKATQPAQLLSLIDAPALQLKAAELYIEHTMPPQDSLGLVAPCQPLGPSSSTSPPRKIKVAYVSADFKHHAVCILMAELFELHDRAHFEIYAFDSTLDAKDPGDEMRQRVMKAFDHVEDIRHLSDQEAAALARRLGVDIAVDLGGHTHGSRTGLFAYRAAPVQLSYLGYLGTIGAPYMDYLLADKTIIPESQQPHYAEKIAYLPCYQVNDPKREVSDKRFSKAELGVQTTGVLYCSFNNNYKITPQVFQAWMRILKAVPESSLLLLADNPSVERHLQEVALASGLEPQRLVFGARLKTSDYLARYKTPDLFLDTFPYNAGTTASDALWVGLPVLTFAGESFASRMAASALMGVGLEELITQSIEAYTLKAIELGLHPERLHALKQQLAHQRAEADLFNAPKFTRHLEALYRAMVERSASGQTVEHIDLSPTPLR